MTDKNQSQQFPFELPDNHPLCPRCGYPLEVDDKDESFYVDGYEVDVTIVEVSCENCGYMDEYVED